MISIAIFLIRNVVEVMRGIVVNQTSSRWTGCVAGNLLVLRDRAGLLLESDLHLDGGSSEEGNYRTGGYL